MKKEWYENTEWNSEIENLFESKLSKAQVSKKPQYLIAQANALKGEWNNISKQLIDRVLNDYAQDQLSYAIAMNLMGDVLFGEGNLLKAEECFRYVHYDLKTIFREKMKNGFDGSDVKLIKIILITAQKDKYDEAYELIKKHDTDLDFFKYYKYDFTYHAAWLCKELGKIDEAKEYARMALELAIDKRPDAPRHPTVGLVDAPEEELKFLSDIVYRS